jgi:hypothetical protein
VEDLVGRVAARLGERGGVDDGVVAADDRERVAGVGEVGLLVARDVRAGGLEHRRADVAGGDLVAGLVEGVDGGRADLAAGAGDEDPHGAAPYGLAVGPGFFAK